MAPPNTNPAPDTQPGPLSIYTILDITNELGSLCGKWLADLGADVIKIEPPVPADNVGDNHVDGVHWQFMNQGKRCVTLDLDCDQGQQTFRNLVAKADVVLESGEPGWLAERGIAFDDLLAINPRLVMTSLTPFGCTGPFANYRATDLILQAVSGLMYVTGDIDRPPVRISVPQAALHGSAEAGVNTLVALYHANNTGQGQHVDVSAQLATLRALMNGTHFPLLEGRNLTRQGGEIELGPVRYQMVYEAKDGHVSMMLVAGQIGMETMQGVLHWAAEHIEVPQNLLDIDWVNINMMTFMTDPDVRANLNEAIDVFARFLPRFTKSELYEKALEKRWLLAPVSTVADVREDIQLQARGYFVPTKQSSGKVVNQLGAWAQLSKTPLKIGLSAPGIGEDNEAVYLNILGITPAQLQELRSAGVI